MLTSFSIVRTCVEGLEELGWLHCGNKREVLLDGLAPLLLLRSVFSRNSD